MFVLLSVSFFLGRRNVNWTSREESYCRQICVTMRNWRRIWFWLECQAVLRFGARHFGQNTVGKQKALMPVLLNPLYSWVYRKERIYLDFHLSLIHISEP